MTATMTKPARTRAFRDTQGRCLWIGDGAIAQDDKLQLYVCNTCGGEVVWATSKRTGRKYLVDVCRGEVSRYYRKDLVHDCAKRRAAADSAVQQYIAYADRKRYAEIISAWEGIHEIVEANAPRTPRDIATWINHLLSNDELTTAWARYYG